MEINRKNFLKKSSFFTFGKGSLMAIPATAAPAPEFIKAEKGINIIGPKKGYSPQIGSLVSMMDWMRSVILIPVQDMSADNLDYRR